MGQQVKRALLYKVGKIDHSLCKCCCVNKFHHKGLEAGEKAYNWTKTCIVVVLALNMAVQITLTILDFQFESTLYSGIPL